MITIPVLPLCKCIVIERKAYIAQGIMEDNSLKSCTDVHFENPQKIGSHLVTFAKVFPMYDGAY